MSARWKLFLGLALSGALLYWVARLVDLGRLWQQLVQVEYPYVTVAAASWIGLLYIRALRWRILMAPLKAIAVGPLFSATAIGFMANGLLPARMGELVRAYVIGRREGVKMSASFATIVVERVFDGMAILMMLFALALFMPVPQGMVGMETEMRSIGVIALLANGVVMGLLLLAWFKREGTLRLAARILSPFPMRVQEGGQGVVRSFLEGLAVVQGRRELAWVAAWSLGLWLLSVVPNYLLFLAFHLPLSLHAAAFLLVAMAFGVLIPSSPGYVGTYHAAVVMGLAAYGVPRETGLGFAVLAHAVAFLPVIAVGLFFLWRENLTLGQIGRVK